MCMKLADVMVTIRTCLSLRVDGDNSDADSHHGTQGDDPAVMTKTMITSRAEGATNRNWCDKVRR